MRLREAIRIGSHTIPRQRENAAGLPSVRLSSPTGDSIKQRFSRIKLRLGWTGDRAQRSISRSKSERILVSCKRAGAAIDPHGFVAFAWAVVGHAGGAPGRSGDLAALASMCSRRNAMFARFRLS